MKPLALLTALLAILALAAMAVVVAKRHAAANTAERIAPGTMQTSGCEVESFFAIWRAAHRQPVYADLHRIPFGSAYFNWLFYAAYGGMVRAPLQSHGDAALPHLTRRLTLIGAAVGAAIAAFLLLGVAGSAAPGLRWLAAAIGAFLFFGPLPGWWVITARPDLWALGWETAAVTLLLLAPRKYSPVSVVGVALLFYAAWSCKQNFVGVGLAAWIFLLVRRRWRDAVVLGTVSLVLVALTLLVLGSNYRAALREMLEAVAFNRAIGLASVGSAALKTIPLLLGVPVVVRALRSTSGDSHSTASDALLLGGLGTLTTLALALPASFKVGAISNYYFSSSLMLALAVVAALALRPARWSALGIAAGLALLSLAPLSSRVGTLDLRPDADRLARRWAYWKTQPEPRFSSDLALNLPWLAPHSPPFVRAYNYFVDRARGWRFEAGGIGGLIDSGYFASLLLPESTGDSYDDGRLSSYRRDQDVAGLAPFRRLDSATSNPPSPP